MTGNSAEPDRMAAAAARSRLACAGDNRKPSIRNRDARPVGPPTVVGRLLSSCTKPSRAASTVAANAVNARRFANTSPSEKAWPTRSTTSRSNS